MAKMSGWICQDEYRERLDYLSDQELGRLTRAMMDYHIDGTLPDLKGREIGAFYFIKADIDSAEKKYDEKCRKNSHGKSSVNDDGKRTSTIDSERIRTHANDSERIRTVTNTSERVQTDTNYNYNKNNNVNSNLNVYEEEEEEDARAREKLIDEDWKMVADCYQQQIGMLPMGRALDDLTSYVDDLHGETVCKAIEITNRKTPDNPHQFLMAILRNFANHGIDSREKAEAYILDYERRKKGNDRRNAPVCRNADQRTNTGALSGEGSGGTGECGGDVEDRFYEYLKSTHI